jgi:hypothetical protein
MNMRPVYLEMRFLLGMAISFAASPGGVFAAESPVAMVAEITGEAELVQDGKGSLLRLLEELKPGASVRLKPDARVVLLFVRDGDQYALSGPGIYTVDRDRPHPRSPAAAPARLGPVLGKNGKALYFKDRNFSQAGLVMRAYGKSSIPARLPAGPVTLGAPPAFEWEAVGKEVDYEFVLKDDRGNTLFSRIASENKLPLPPDLALDPGATYRWSVSTRGNDGARYFSSHQFRVSDPSMKVEYDNFCPADSATLAEHVAFVAWLESQGLMDEAARYWGALKKRYGISGIRY